MSSFLDKFEEGFNKYPSDILSPIKPPRNEFYGLYRPRTTGGVAVGNTSEPLYKYIWDSEYNIHTGDFHFWRRDLGESTKEKIFTIPNIYSLDFCFDQNMRPFICYEKDLQSYYWHFNAETSTYDEVVLEGATRFPRCFLYTDLEYTIPDSDIVLMYLRDHQLSCRVQRERFLNERRVLNDPKKTMLWKAWLAEDGRVLLQWR